MSHNSPENVRREMLLKLQRQNMAIEKAREALKVGQQDGVRYGYPGETVRLTNIEMEDIRDRLDGLYRTVLSRIDNIKEHKV